LTQGVGFGVDVKDMDVLLGTGTRLTAAVAVLAASLALAGPAGAASPIGADGSIHGCYVAKGKKKGQLRLLPAGKSCKRKKKEKPIVWSVQGPAGSAGAPGGQGPQGASGISSEQLSALVERINQQDATIASLQTTITGLTTTVSGLLTQVGTLQGVLTGITNGDLTGVLNKLTGLTGVQLQAAAGSVADVNALCAQVSDLTTFGNALRSSVGGLTVGGIGALFAPGLPAALSAFAC
jgi:hypothetical protein